MAGLSSDLAAARRRLGRSRAHVAGVLLAVALATASAAAVYAVVNAVLLRPLPYRDPERLVFIWATRTDRDQAFFSVADFLDHRESTRALAEVAAFTGWAGNRSGSAGERERLLGARVTPNGLALLGVRPVLGRLPGPEDLSPEADPVVALSHGLWKRRFGASPAALGATLRLDEVAYRVVGVLEPEFLFPGVPAEMVGLLDLPRDARRADRGTNFLRAFGRLAEGATREQVRDEWGAFARELRARYPETNAKKTEPRVVPLSEEMLGLHRRSLLALLAAVAAVLLLACFNVATLEVQRGLGRASEWALRRALGATPLDLLRLQSLETGLPVAAGALVGLGLAHLALPTLVSLAPVSLPRAAEASVDWLVGSSVFAVVALAGAFGAFLPLLRAARRPRLAGLVHGRPRADGPGPGGPLRQALATAEVAAAAVLLATTVLTVLTLRRLEAEGPGIRVDGLLHARLSLPASRYPSQAALEAYVARLRASLRSEVGVTGADVATALPLSGQNVRTDFVVLGREPRTAAEVPGAQLRFVSAGYVETVGLPLRRGRGFREEDEAARAAVALVDEALARQLWPDRDPVGDSLRIEGPSNPVFRVVGVVGRVKHFGLDEAPLGTLYLPVHALPPHLRGFFVGNHTLAVGGEVLGAEARRRVAAAVQRVDSEVSASALTSMRETLAGAQSARAFAAWLGALFAAAALLLAVSGLYAVAAARAQDQLRELAVRLALGASPASVGLRLLAGAARPLVWGLAIGVPLAWAAVGALGPDVVPEVRARPEVWALAPAVLLLAGLLAVLPPAWRAARLDVARLLGEG